MLPDYQQNFNKTQCTQGHCVKFLRSDTSDVTKVRMQVSRERARADSRFRRGPGKPFHRARRRPRGLTSFPLSAETEHSQLQIYRIHTVTKNCENSSTADDVIAVTKGCSCFGPRCMNEPVVVMRVDLSPRLGGHTVANQPTPLLSSQSHSPSCFPPTLSRRNSVRSHSRCGTES